MMETEAEKTPLQQKLDEFGEQLSKVRNLSIQHHLQHHSNNMLLEQRKVHWSLY